MTSNQDEDVTFTQDQIEQIDALVRRLTDHQVEARSERGVTRLKSLYESFQQVQEFKQGNLVIWKEGLKNKRRPAYGQPAVVTMVLPDPVIDDESGSGTTYFREPLDLVIGFLDDEDELVELYVDSRRIAHLGNGE